MSEKFNGDNEQAEVNTWDTLTTTNEDNNKSETNDNLEMPTNTETEAPKDAPITSYTELISKSGSLLSQYPEYADREARYAELSAKMDDRELDDNEKRAQDVADYADALLKNNEGNKYYEAVFYIVIRFVLAIKGGVCSQSSI